MKRSKFSLSNYKLFSCDMGELVPCGLTEVLPGDTIQHATSALVRCAPLATPPMHPVNVSFHHWFVPHRLVWEDWEDFITGGPDGEDLSTFPTITFGGGTGAAVGSLADYLGVTPSVNNLVASALPFRGYALIWNEWYRDQDLQSELTIDLTSGADTTTSTTLQNGAWEKDYFTSARPFEQKGPAITIPIGTSAPITGMGMVGQTYAAGPANSYETDGTAASVYASYQNSAATITRYEEDPNNPGFPNIRADLTNASAVTINALREAMALQRFAEARARYGSRYTEYLRSQG